MGKIKRKLNKKSSNNKSKHHDDADFESAVSFFKKTQVDDPRELRPAPAAAAESL